MTAPDQKVEKEGSRPPSKSSSLSLIPFGLFLSSVGICGGMLRSQDKSAIWSGLVLMWMLNGLAIIAGFALLAAGIRPRLIIVSGMILAVLMGLFAEFASWRQ